MGSSLPFSASNRLLQQLVEGQRQITNALARRIEHGVRDRGAGAGDADLNNPVRALTRTSQNIAPWLCIDHCCVSSGGGALASTLTEA